MEAPKPLQLAAKITEQVNAAWLTGEMLEQVTPMTRDLLTWWFSEGYVQLRRYNFHPGQRQAILNIIYLHEILAVNSVADVYIGIDDALIDSALMEDFAKPKNQTPKYAVKMATGTGKTWVMHALLLWQMLNARHENSDRITSEGANNKI